MQRLRNTLSQSRANRPFVIMMFGLGGLLILGVLAVVLMLALGNNNGDAGERVAQQTATLPSSLPATDTPVPSPTAAPTDTPRPTATRVLAQDTPKATSSVETPTAEAATPTATEPAATSEPTGSAATPTPLPDQQTPQTGLNWGWVAAIGLGLAGLVILARRLRLAT